jgi:hypothetical protein
MASNVVKALVVTAGFLLLSWIFSFLATPYAGAMETARREYSNGISDREYGDPMERGERPERDWYEKKYESYEESPYGYYEEGHFYDDFDFDYWDRDSEKNTQDWYEKRFGDYTGY